MKYRIIIAAIVFSFSSFHVQGQKVVHNKMLWFGYHNLVKFSSKWSVQSDFQLRTKGWANQWSQLAVRASAGYKINEQFRLGSGFCLFKNVQYVHDEPLFKNEWRPFQDVTHTFRFLKKYQLNQRLRAEERFLQEVQGGKKISNYDYIFRMRYRFEFEKQLSQHWKFGIGNEILVNPGYVGHRHFWDHNRSFAGIQYKVSKTTAIQFQYIKIYQWRVSPSILENGDVLRLNIYQEFYRPFRHLFNLD